MSYSNVISHNSMVFDEHRNSLYGDAIRKHVNADSIVLDLGAGLGLHGFMAARAGAKKVYLVEPMDVIHVTEMVGHNSGLCDNIEHIHTTIEEAQLPEPVDVIISVFTGNFLLTEDLLPSLIYARDRFLAPGGKLIPDRARMVVVPVSASDYYDKHINCWSTPAQDIDYSLVRKYATNDLYYGNQKAMRCEYLAAPAEILDLDLMTTEKAECNNTIEVTITSDGICDGFLGWFQARLGNEWLSTSPHDKETHWSQAFLPLDPQLSVKAGQTITIGLKRLEHGEWTWTVEVGGVRQRHSTFLASPLSQTTLRKKSDSHTAALNEKGNIALQILQKLDGSESTARLAASLVDTYPDIFPTGPPVDE